MEIPEELMLIGESIAADMPSRITEINRQFAAMVIARALLAERERCAKIAADVLASNNDVDSWDDGYRVAAEEILDAIRTPSTDKET